MHRLLLRACICVVGLGVLYGCSKKPAETNHPERIREVFAAYKDALLTGDGDVASNMMDRATIDWYGDAVSDALKLGREDLNQLNLLRKFTVLRLRLEFSRDDLAKMTGKGLFGLAVTNGWISKSTVEKIALATITVHGRLASASIESQPGVPLFYFTNEDQNWRLALTKSFPVANAVFRKWCDESGVPEDEYLLSMLGAVSKFRVDKSILDGPRD